MLVTTRAAGPRRTWCRRPRPPSVGAVGVTCWCGDGGGVGARVERARRATGGSGAGSRCTAVRSAGGAGIAGRATGAVAGAVVLEEAVPGRVDGSRGRRGTAGRARRRATGWDRTAVPADCCWVVILALLPLDGVDVSVRQGIPVAAVPPGRTSRAFARCRCVPDRWGHGCVRNRPRDRRQPRHRTRCRVRPRAARVHGRHRRSGPGPDRPGHREAGR